MNGEGPVVTRAVLLVGLVLVVGPARAQAPEEFPLPAFDAPAADGGVDAADAGVPSVPPLPAPTVGAPVPPPPPRWNPLAGFTTLLVTGLTQGYLGLEVGVLGTVVGTPAPSREVLGAAEGWLLQAGVHGAWGKVATPLCRGTAFCATRTFGGVSVRGGWARGTVALKDGLTRAQAQYFAQLDVDASYFHLESAPLAPGRSTWELLTRLRLGLQWTAPGARLTTTGVTLLGAAVLEAVPLGAGTQTVSVGASVGFGF
jgi:hypothetical protein